MTVTMRFTVVLLVALSACAANAEDDPTSVAALRKAPPFKYGTTCTRVERSSYGTSKQVNRTPLCIESSECGSSGPSSSSAYAGGLEWYGSTTFEDKKWFEGTCAARKPVTCDSRPAANACASCSYAKCCVEMALCEDDPNCVATAACMNRCGADVTCAQRCASNSQEGAYKHYYAAIKCASTSCASACTP